MQWSLLFLFLTCSCEHGPHTQCLSLHGCWCYSGTLTERLVSQRCDVVWPALGCDELCRHAVCAMWCAVVPCCRAVRCGVHSTAQHRTAQHSTMQHNTTQPTTVNFMVMPAEVNSDTHPRAEPIPCSDVANPAVDRCRAAAVMVALLGLLQHPRKATVSRVILPGLLHPHVPDDPHDSGPCPEQNASVEPRPCPTKNRVVSHNTPINTNPLGWAGFKLGRVGRYSPLARPPLPPNGSMDGTKTDRQAPDQTRSQNSAEHENCIFGISAARGFMKVIICHVFGEKN